VSGAMWGMLASGSSNRSLRRAFWEISPFVNPWLVLGAGVMICLQLLFTYLPLMNSIFHTAPISLTSWFGVLGLAIAAVVAVEIEKRIGEI
jgi:cation-transporting P-type ATPase F